MLRFVMRILLSPGAIMAINAVILVLMIMVAYDALHGLMTMTDLTEPMEVIEDIGVIMIGWGVALEERKEMRLVFGIVNPANESWQEDVDRTCHRTGIGQLVFGLFIEICLSIVRLPSRIVDTTTIDEYLVGVGTAFLGIGLFILVRHNIVLAKLMGTSNNGVVDRCMRVIGLT
jgi:hypothetical protein